MDPGFNDTHPDEGFDDEKGDDISTHFIEWMEQQKEKIITDIEKF